MTDAKPWHYRHVASRLEGTPRSIALCGLYSHGEDPRLTRAVRDDGSVRVGTSGLVLCKRTSCPVCHASWIRDRADDLIPLLREYEAMGGVVRHLTMTVRHDAGMPLAMMIDAMQESWRRFTATAFKGLGKQTPIVPEMNGLPWLRVLQVTRSIRGSGWHPHYHCLLLLPPGVEPGPDFEGRLSRTWIDAVAFVARKMAPDVAERLTPWPANATRLTEHRDGERIASYVLGTLELLDDRGKSAGDLAKTPGLTPLQLLEDERKRHLWVEYANAVQGRRLLVWGGLRGAKTALVNILRDAGFSPEPVERPSPVRVDEISINAEDWQWMSTSLDGLTSPLDALLPILSESVERALEWIGDRGWRAERVTAPGKQPPPRP